MKNIKKSTTHDSFYKLSKKIKLRRNYYKIQQKQIGILTEKLSHTHANKRGRHRAKSYPIALYAKS